MSYDPNQCRRCSRGEPKHAQDLCRFCYSETLSLDEAKRLVRWYVAENGGRVFVLVLPPNGSKRIADDIGINPWNLRGSHFETDAGPVQIQVDHCIDAPFVREHDDQNARAAFTAKARAEAKRVRRQQKKERDLCKIEN